MRPWLIRALFDVWGIGCFVALVTGDYWAIRVALPAGYVVLRVTMKVIFRDIEKLTENRADSARDTASAV
jgi:hypothetical protein